MPYAFYLGGFGWLNSIVFACRCMSLHVFASLSFPSFWLTAVKLHVVPPESECFRIERKTTAAFSSLQKNMKKQHVNNLCSPKNNIGKIICNLSERGSNQGPDALIMLVSCVSMDNSLPLFSPMSLILRQRLSPKQKGRLHI